MTQPNLSHRAALTLYEAALVHERGPATYTLLKLLEWTPPYPLTTPGSEHRILEAAAFLRRWADQIQGEID